MPVQYVGFSDDLRTLIAELDLERERGEITLAEHDTLKASAIAAEQDAIGLDGTWRTDQAPAEPHHPTGKTSVFWCPIPSRSLLQKVGRTLKKLIP